jgi:hypothetical protein
VPYAPILDTMKDGDTSRRKNSNPSSYTVLEASPAEEWKGTDGALENPSALVLERGPGFYRNELFHMLQGAGFNRIVHVGKGNAAILGESSSPISTVPGVRHLIPSENPSPGERINMGMRELKDGLVLVLWSDMTLASRSMSRRLLEKAFAQDLLCLVPELVGADGKRIASALPFARVPPRFAGRPILYATAVYDDLDSTLFPFDYCGLYDVARFCATGGFDERVKDPLRQTTDFGVKAWHSGQEIRMLSSLSLVLHGGPEKTTDAVRELRRPAMSAGRR